MKFLNTAFGRLAYQKLGNGKEVYLFFHGFGQNMKVYQSFSKLRKPEESYLIIDMFYHGQSSWKSVSQKLTKEIRRKKLR